MPRPTITVAIPYYSGRHYLAEAIASVQAQTERNGCSSSTTLGRSPPTSSSRRTGTSG